MNSKDFRDEIYQLMRLLPKNRVTTYGDLAAFAGHPYAARQVGAIAYIGSIDIPWHRLVNSKGGLAVGFPGGVCVQQRLLEEDGICCDENGKVDNFNEIRWKPST